LQQLEKLDLVLRRMFFKSINISVTGAFVYRCPLAEDILAVPRLTD